MCVFDINIFDTDAEYYDEKHQHKIMSHHERHKKGKYIEAFLEQLRHFTLLVFSVDGVMGEDIKVATKQLDADMSNRWDREY